MRQRANGAEGPAQAEAARMRPFGRPDAGRLARATAIAAGCLLAACAGMTDSQRPSLEEVEARMPREIAGFVQGDIAQRPGPLLSMDYATANRAAVATVLVYESGGRAAPDNPAAPEIDRELSAAVMEVTEAPAGRTGRRLTERERVTLADAGLRCARMEGSFGRAPVARTLCVGGAQGRFVKIQVTMAARTPAPADATAFAAGAMSAVRGR